MNKQDDTVKTAISRLAAECSKAEHSTGEMCDKMRRWEMSEEQQAQVISYLIEKRYVDDERFARLFIQDKIRFNRWGPKKIEQALWMKHVDERVYREQLEAVSDEQWQEALQPLLESKRKSIHASSPYELRAKLIRYAMGRGFTMDQIQQCLSCDE
ncbi:MAG: RecX family transcriptional regulator [Prevotella sp.]|nr:RecX family transcriptional regulator [Prevotella sp.]